MNNMHIKKQGENHLALCISIRNYLTIRLNLINLSIHIKNTNLLGFLEKYTSIYI